MSGLRRKLIIGFGSLLVLLLVTGSISLYLLTEYSGTVDRVFRENYRSVVYGQAMKDAIDRLNDLLDEAQEPTSTTSERQCAALMDQFNTNLANESANITIAGEGDIVRELVGVWQRYQGLLFEFRGIGVKRQPKETPPKQAVLLMALEVKAQAQRVIDINLKNIISADGQIRRSAVFARRTMIALLISGIIVAVAGIAMFVRSILVPVRTLIRSAREIERGNLDLVVAAPAGDEVGQLADAFNAMAGKLRENRRSDRLRIVRAQRTTQLTLDSLPDAVAIITSDGKVDLSNQTAQRLFQLRPGVVLAALDQPRLTEVCRQVLTTGKALHPRGFETAIQMFDGEERFFLAHGLPIGDSDGQAAGVTLVLADITGLRRLDEMKSNMLAVVSHELKTPLTGLRMATHLLLDERTGPLTTKQAELLISARVDSERLHTIVEGLLDISRIESGRALMELKPLEMGALVDQAISECSASFKDRGVRLEIAIPADLPPVLADAVRIRHVFANLLGNALKYTPSGGRVSVVAEHQGDLIEVRIDDDGPGIAPEHRARIFERFYRIPGQEQAGAGLGLAIAKEIVLAHGGQLWLAERPGTGSTFCFTLAVAHTRTDHG